MAPLPSDPPRADPPQDGEARADLRAALRARRRALAPRAREAAGRAVLRHLLRLRWLRPGTTIAAYAAIDGELDTAAIITAARARGCRLYLPRITGLRARRMHFLPAAATLVRNRYGIEEPLGTQARAVRRFDLVLVPLVAFDRRGARLGMGAGFYDRAFAFRRLRRVWTGPRIVGLAYAFQEVARIVETPYDVRLDAVITERGVTNFTEGAA